MEALTTRSNWNLEVLVFVEGGKPENPEKNPRSKASKGKVKSTLKPLIRPTLIFGFCSVKLKGVFLLPVD